MKIPSGMNAMQGVVEMLGATSLCTRTRNRSRRSFALSNHDDSAVAEDNLNSPQNPPDRASVIETIQFHCVSDLLVPLARNLIMDATASERK
jgi:hypothetical protein